VRRLIYAMNVSLDGFICGPGGDLGWSAPSEELHRFWNEQTRELGGHLLGRRLYEVMRYWDTAGEDPAMPAYGVEFAAIWKALPKAVFSTTLSSVTGNARLAPAAVAEEVARLKAEPGGDLAIGGAGLAASAIALIDEFRPVVYPAVIGAGTPFFPPSSARIELELLETRTFSGGAVYLRYGRAASDVSGAT
jgi:dihydrofolate reductase